MQRFLFVVNQDTTRFGINEDREISQMGQGKKDCDIGNGVLMEGFNGDRMRLLIGGRFHPDVANLHVYFARFRGDRMRFDFVCRSAK